MFNILIYRILLPFINGVDFLITTQFLLDILYWNHVTHE